MKIARNLAERGVIIKRERKGYCRRRIQARPARLHPRIPNAAEKPGDFAAAVGEVTSGGVRVGTAVLSEAAADPVTGWLMIISLPGTITPLLSSSTRSRTVTGPVAAEGTVPVMVTVNRTSWFAV